MRVFRLSAIVLTMLLPASCSILTSYAGLQSGGTGGEATTSGTGGSGGRSTTASTGGGEGGSGTGGDIRPDAGGDAAMPCKPGTYFCGPDEAGGNLTDLFLCNDDFTSTKKATCYDGCTSPPDGNDHCACVNGGHYCGGDSLVGSPNSLYTCPKELGPEGDLLMHCKNGCKIVPGDDDVCE